MAENQVLGYLIVKVSTASGAIPVENVTVVIQGNDTDNQGIFLSNVTNRDGLTEKFTLPAPDGKLSNAPNPTSRPYSTYNIDIYKEGYYPQHYNNVPIFAGITARPAATSSLTISGVNTSPSAPMLSLAAI